MIAWLVLYYAFAFAVVALLPVAFNYKCAFGIEGCADRMGALKTVLFFGFIPLLLLGLSIFLFALKKPRRRQAPSHTPSPPFTSQ